MTPYGTGKVTNVRKDGAIQVLQDWKLANDNEVNSYLQVDSCIGKRLVTPYGKGSLLNTRFTSDKVNKVKLDWT